MSKRMIAVVSLVGCALALVGSGVAAQTKTAPFKPPSAPQLTPQAPAVGKAVATPQLQLELAQPIPRNAALTPAQKQDLFRAAKIEVGPSGLGSPLTLTTANLSVPEKAHIVLSRADLHPLSQSSGIVLYGASGSKATVHVKVDAGKNVLVDFQVGGWAPGTLRLTGDGIPTTTTTLNRAPGQHVSAIVTPQQSGWVRIRLEAEGAAQAVVTAVELTPLP